MAVKTMQDLFIEELRDIYHAEKQLVRALPKMARAASSADLKAAFQDHLEETKEQVGRIEQIFDTLDQRKRAKPCEAMEGLIEEAKEMMEEIETPEVLDVALIGGAQKVEHYEIASYGTLAAMAKSLGHKEAQQLLEITLKEEKAADEKLNKIGVSNVNKKALQAAA